MSLLQQWSRQIGANKHRRRSGASRLAAVSYQCRRPLVDQLIEVEHLVFVVVYQIPIRNRSIRLAGFSGSRIPFGVQWGGPNGSKFDKDLSLPPIPGAHGRQLDLAQAELVELGLNLHHRLQRHECLHHRMSRRLRMPKLWAAFDSSETADVAGDGPELDAMCRRTSKAPAKLLDEYRRHHLGLTLLPLNWVSHRWQSFAAVYADLARFPKRQVIRLRRQGSDLQGYRGASEFDFYHSRFGRQQTKAPRSQRRCSVALDVA